MSFVTLKDFFPKDLSETCVNNSEKSNKNSRLLGKKSNRKVISEYAFLRLKKLPLDTHKNVLSAIIHFYNVKNVSEGERKEAFKKICNKAAQFEICTIEFLKKYEQYMDSAQSS